MEGLPSIEGLIKILLELLDKLSKMHYKKLLLIIGAILIGLLILKIPAIMNYITCKRIVDDIEKGKLQSVTEVNCSSVLIKFKR